MTRSRASRKSTCTITLVLAVLFLGYLTLYRDRGVVRIFLNEARALPEMLELIRDVPRMEDRRTHLWGIRGWAPGYLTERLDSTDVLLLPPRPVVNRMVGSADGSLADARWIAALSRPIFTVRYPDEGWEHATQALILSGEEDGPRVYLVPMDDEAGRATVIGLFEDLGDPR